MSQTGYETDFHAWAFDQARRLRAGEPVDAEHIAEALEGLGMNEEQALESRLIILLAHMLKCEFQPQKHTRSWDLSIKEQRRRIHRLLDKMPSLRSKFDEAVASAYETAILRAAEETGLVEADFPSNCGYTTEEILGEE